MTTKTLTFINQKGGVGKTTLAMLAAAALAASGKTTLAIDFDPLGTLSDLMLERHKKPFPPYTIVDAIAGAPCTGWTRLTECLYILPADNRLEEVLTDMSTNPGNVFNLRSRIADCCAPFDVVVIDAPPSLSALAWAAIIAADMVVVPTLADKTSVKGLTNIMAQIDDIRFSFGMAPSLIGTVANMVDERVITDRQALDALSAEGMPALLGKLPRRRGRNAWPQLQQAFAPIAEELTAFLGNCTSNSHL